jgi:hypothetical protein
MSKAAVKPPSNELYETDFYAWARQQARLLRERRWDDLDLANLVEEVEDVARSNKKEIRSRLEVLVMHLLEYKYQPGGRGPKWRGTIREQRRCVRGVIAESPSLKRYPAKTYLDQYEATRIGASDETGIAYELFPEQCPFTLEEIMDDKFLPEEPGHIGASGK